uniref:Myosin_tail_1 domain-containing protein n=1 Tax=Rhabditophanes sp. KR3021 TaxID=114890 RepID=A0AC35UGV3_9BILA
MANNGLFQTTKTLNELVAALNEKVNDLKEENVSIEHVANFYRQQFKEILTHLQDVINNQNEEIERLEEILDGEKERHENAIKKVELAGQDKLAKMVEDSEKIRLENLLMKTQQNAHQHMKLEMEGLYERMEEMKAELEEKNEKISKKELKEREIAIITSDRVRKEMDVEHAEKIAKIKTELQVQNIAELSASNEMGRKLKEQIREKERNIEGLQRQVDSFEEKVEELSHIIDNNERDKEKVESQVQRISAQNDKALKEIRKMFEDSEKSKLREIEKREKRISDLRKENDLLKKDLFKEKKRSQDLLTDVTKEQELRKQTTDKHKTQNRMLRDLKQFFSLKLSNTGEQYIDTIFGENRMAIFAKLTLLLQNIPQLEY